MNKGLIRGIEPVREHSGNMEHRHRILLEQRGRVGYVKPRGFQCTHIRSVRLVEQDREVTKYGARLRHLGDLCRYRGLLNATVRRWTGQTYRWRPGGSENILRHVLETAGDKPTHKITERAIIEGRDRRAVKTPAQARHFIDTMRGLFRWAAKAKHVKSDPTAGIDYPANPNKDRGGFPAWAEEHVAAYYARWPVGTRQRVWLDVLLFTGLRRGDAVRLGKQHIRNMDGQTAFTMKTEKTGAVVTVEIFPEFDATLRAGPCGDLAFIAGANGRPMTKESFGNEFREACRAAGVPGSAHGVRKLASQRVAEAGATDAEMDAIFGWSGGRMSSLYTRGANRVRLARGGMSKLRKANEERTSIPAPKGKVRERMRKGK